MSVYYVNAASCDYPGCKSAHVPASKMSAMELRIVLAKNGWNYIPKNRGERVITRNGYPGRGMAGAHFKFVNRTKSADLCPDHADRASELVLTIPDDEAAA